MPSFFSFQQGSEARTPPPPDSRYGRFRIIPEDNTGNGSGSTYNSYGAIGSRGAALGGLMWGSGNARVNIEPVDLGDLGDEEGGGGGGGGGGGRGGRGGGGSADGGDDGEGEDVRWWWERWVLSPRQKVVKVVVRSWWLRNGIMTALPAVITIIWCAIPFPTYPLDEDENKPPPPLPPSTNTTNYPLTPPSLLPPPIPTTEPPNNLPNLILAVISEKLHSRFLFFQPSTLASNPSPGPGHGEALVRLDFWFFLIVYYGFYNLVGLMWITKLFNLYSLNWWPSRLGFPLSYTFFWSVSLLLAIPLYMNGNLVVFTSYNMTWILLTFTTMTWPMLVAFLVMVSEHRHLSLSDRWAPSETQALFLSWSPRRSRRSPGWGAGRGHWPSTTSKKHFNYNDPFGAPSRPRRPSTSSSLTHSFWTSTHLPTSYLRFLHFLLLLLISLLAYFLGEAYSEIYLRTLPHSTLSTLVYVYSWILTIYLLDFLTSYILTTHILSPPLQYVYKLFFALTYQTFVRAIYARLRSPQQFLVLQLVAGGGGVAWYLLCMCSWWHRALVYLGFSDQDLDEYRKYVGRSVHLRWQAENISMIAWLGWVLVLHYGSNKSVYPYFAFESGTGGWWPTPGTGDKTYTFELTFFASMATWICELSAAYAVRKIMRWLFAFDIVREEKKELVQYPELVGAGVVVAVHVLQNMLVGIVRVRFH